MADVSGATGKIRVQKGYFSPKPRDACIQWNKFVPGQNWPTDLRRILFVHLLCFASPRELFSRVKA